MWLTAAELSLKECVPIDEVLEAVDEGIETAEIDGQVVINAEAFAEWKRSNGSEEVGDGEEEEGEEEEEEEDDDEG